MKWVLRGRMDDTVVVVRRSYPRKQTGRDIPESGNFGSIERVLLSILILILPTKRITGSSKGVKNVGGIERIVVRWMMLRLWLWLWGGE